jgi:hypothetical protein
MDKRLRPIPYPIGSAARRRFIAAALRYDGVDYRQAVAQVVAANGRARNGLIRGEQCGAKTRKGTPCRCKAMRNGRCRLHGGCSTGPRTVAGKKRSAANLPLNRGQ